MEQLDKNLPSTFSATYGIDQQQAQRHLKYLGYSNKNVFLRFFYHSDDPRKDNDKGRKLNYLQWQEIESYQRDGRGVYVVVNGAKGGHEDREINQCVAIFCEWDDRPVEKQLQHWETVGFLEPTFTVYSGDKSAQPYWVFEHPITVEQWRELQCLLIEVMGADPSNKNPSRVFRLAGGWHVKPGREPNRSEIVQDSGKKYRYEQVRQELLHLHSQLLANDKQPKAPIQPPQSSTTPVTTPYVWRFEDIPVPVSFSVPLEICLSKESRHLLDSGVGEGGRNTGGAKLARDLIGTANYLQSIGQSFEGNPRLLLENYANRCSPPLPFREVETIWHSAEKDNPTPSCTPEGVDACIRGWYWKHRVKPQPESTQKERNYAAGRGFGYSNNGKGGNNLPIATVSLCDRIREILNRYDSESVTATALMELASATGRTYNEIDRLARIIRAEGELATEVIEAVESFQGILKSCRKRLDIRLYLEKTLSDPLMAKAAAMPTAPEYLFNTFLASSASRIGTVARVIINPQGGYSQPCIFWTANVNHSGQAKTPPQQVILQPLEEMEATAKEIHDRSMEDYEATKDSDAKVPVRQRRLLNNVTTSTKIRIHDENPRGLLEYIDELVADYQRLNQYKSGKGDDLQLELSFWNGSGGNFDRHDARLFLKRVALSKTGTYQWDTLARLMGADEVNFIASGYSSRFLYCSIVDAPARFLDLLSTPNPAADELKEKLSWLYAQLEQLPETDYFLSHQAKVLFQGWNHTLVNAEMEEKHFGLSLVYAKIESYTARLALWLHVVNAVLRGEKPQITISGRTMQHAIEIASFYLDQHKLIHAHNAPTRQPEGIFLKVQTQAEKILKKCGKGVSASFLKSRINALKGWAVEKIRSSIFKALAAAGHGRIEGEGSEMVYIPNPPTDDLPGDLVSIGEELAASPIAQTSNNSDLQASIGEIGEDSAVRGCPPLRSHCVAEGTSVVASGVQLSGEDSTVRPLPPLSEVSGERATLTTFSQPLSDALAPPPNHRKVTSTEAKDAQYCPHREMLMGETNMTTLAHQFTNPVVETTTATGLDSVDAPTNSSPIAPTEKTRQQQSPTAGELAEQILLCSTWIEIASRVKENTNTLVKAAKEMTATQRQGLTRLLSEHLCQSPIHLTQLLWVPQKLRQRTLERLQFTIRRIANVAENVLDLGWESISGCRLEKIGQIGMPGEAWLFLAPDGTHVYAYPDAVEAISCCGEL